MLGTALLWPEMSRVAGVETQEDLHKLAVAADAKAREADGLRCDFVLGDAREAMGEGGPLEDASIIFAYHSPKDCCTWFAEFCATCLRPGCRVIYCDKLLEGEGLELIDRIEGVNPPGDGRQLDRPHLRGDAERSERLRRARERGGGLHIPQS